MSANSGFPDGALACGADLVIQSPHKTLPSLTQTAFLHLQGNLVDPEIIEEQLDIFETSSPSYPLLASLDGCTGIIREHGRELFESWKERLERFDNSVMPLQKLRVFNRLTGAERNLQTRSSLIYDPGKILIDAAGAGMTGRELASFLREKKHIEIEMTQGSLVLAMTSLCDDENALDLLMDALAEIDAKAFEAF
jgi:arginine/lysine/ornithine decarboxylase